MDEIKFGTSGWRGIIAKDFTFANVRIVVRAIADHLLCRADGNGEVVIGHDNRFMGEEFAREAAGVLAAAGIKSCLCRSGVPTPVIAFEILRRQLPGGINFTASHNPAPYQGIKFSPEWGGPALPATTSDLEDRIKKLQKESSVPFLPFEQALHKGWVREIDPSGPYRERLKQLVDIGAIAAAGLKVAFNPLFGVGQGFLDGLLRDAGVEVVTVNNRPDPLFGGHPPEPAPDTMADFIALVKGDPCLQLGLATDGDADRYGVVDRDGTFIEPNYILPLLFDYLIRRRGVRKAAARTVATSHFLDAVGRHHGVQVHETAVGFKYIGELIRDERILIGGEESAGLSIEGHIPEKDGILACLLVAEMVAVERKSLGELLADLYRRVGSFYTRRVNIRLNPELQRALKEKLATPPSVLAGKKVARHVTLDGSKFLFEDGTWILYRLSGTEPVVRTYVEAFSLDELERMATEAVGFISG
ncbi:MAG: phosphoglucomutase/phosphomannomutase family protein [Deltaproteobacteria bacterium]|nr:phosphoglucomutase/phosphomannomutase family protein [Deltaproteobacteria bacterium]